MSEGDRHEEWGAPDWESSVEIVEEERVVSYRRRVLHGKIDLMRAELARRGGPSLSPEELARVLMGSEGEKRHG